MNVKTFKGLMNNAVLLGATLLKHQKEYTDARIKDIMSDFLKQNGIILTLHEDRSALFGQAYNMYKEGV
jgi:hypothetical protein